MNVGKRKLQIYNGEYENIDSYITDQDTKISAQTQVNNIAWMEQISNEGE